MSRWVKTTWLGVCLGPFFLILAAAAVSGGCAHIRAGSLEAVKPTSDAERAGNVYLVRGWIGIWSFGMDQLSDKLKDQGIRCNVYQDAQTDELAAELVKIYRGHPDHEPIVLIGHSLGADDVIKLARALDDAKVPVDLLVTVDPVVPDRIPKNVRQCINYFHPNGAWDNLPMFRGIPVTPEAAPAPNVHNIDIVNDRTDLLEEKTTHFNIDKNPKVHNEIIKQVVATLPPKPKWLATRAGSPIAARTDGQPPAANPASPGQAQLVGDSHPKPSQNPHPATYDPANFNPNPQPPSRSAN